MRKMVDSLKRLMRREEEGATMVEYGLMIALIAVVCIAVVIGIGKSLNIGFGNVNTQLSSATGS